MKKLVITIMVLCFLTVGLLSGCMKHIYTPEELIAGESNGDFSFGDIVKIKGTLTDKGIDDPNPISLGPYWIELNSILTIHISDNEFNNHDMGSVYSSSIWYYGMETWISYDNWYPHMD